MKSRNALDRHATFARGLLAPALLSAVLLTLPDASLIAGSRGTGSDPLLLAKLGNDYKLGALDKVRVKVFAWRAARDEVFEWSALNDEYVVGPAGTISLPLIGDVPAAGSTTSELARAIGELLRDRIGLVESPDASVQVVQFRPFYIIGQVDKPGEYPFRPGMTVLQALSIASGYARGAEYRLEREIISTTGDLEVMEAEKAQLVARKARLEAELTDAEEIRFPAILSEARDPESVEAARKQETMIFKARREAHDTQLRALKQLREYLEMEVDSLKKQLVSHDQQVALVREELDSIRSLVAKKLAIDSRRIGLERNLVQVEGDRLRLESGLMRAKQDISRTEISMLELQNKRTNDVTGELGITEARLDQLERRIETAERLISESETTLPRFAERTRGRKLKPVYTIVRQTDGMNSEIPALDTTAIEPGDTIRVDLLPPDSPYAPAAPQPSADAGSPRRLSQDARRF